MLVTVLNPQQLAYQVGDGIMCDRLSIVARATRFAVRANDVAPEGGVRFPGEIIITSSSFAPRQVLSFGSLDYVAEYNGELHPFEETLSEDNESPASYPQARPPTSRPGGPHRADLTGPRPEPHRAS